MLHLVVANGRPYKDFIGFRAGTWTVISEAGFGGGECMRWNVRCECGLEQVKHSTSILKWKGRCQCTGGRPDTMHPLYGVWANMKHRCASKKHKSYSIYGGRGITVCERWLGIDGLKNFIADVGDRPPGTTLDRIDPNGNYEPRNVRWATSIEQSRNQRLSRYRVKEILDALSRIVAEHPNTTSEVIVNVLKKQLLGQ